MREIQEHLLEIYQVEVSTSLISNATEAVIGAVIEEVKAWQNRQIESVYPIVYLDAIIVKIRHEGKKEVLDMWQAENEGARFWLSVASELKNRGLKDIFICCADGFEGYPKALEALATFRASYDASHPAIG